jgi:hypothetical protein
VYIDYAVRQPVAWLGDYENIALDREGIPFPFAPFFSPKHLPVIYLGLSPGALSLGRKLQGPRIELAFHLLHALSSFSGKETVQIDVSHAEAPSLGAREVVLSWEESRAVHVQGRDRICVQPRFLRLSTQRYEQELNNFKQLEARLFAEVRVSELLAHAETSTILRLEPQIFDFRLPQIAFFAEKNS